MSEGGTPALSGGERWQDLAREAARRRGVAAESVDLVQLLSFDLAGAPYALPVERVREIVRIRPITSVPRMPSHVCGVVSLRGEIVQVLDLRRCLGLPPATPARATRIVVVHGTEGGVAGLLVDGVTEVFSAAEDALRPAASEGGGVEALCARGETFVSLIALDRVLSFDGQ